MRLDVYQRETALIAAEQTSLLNEVSDRLNANGTLSRLEMNGVLHALQVLVENAIGKAKQLLKVSGGQIPVSAYDSIDALATLEIIEKGKLGEWRSAIGLRNRIVHDYMNIDFEQVKELVREKRYQFVTDFLTMEFDVEMLKRLLEGK